MALLGDICALRAALKNTHVL